MPNVIRAARSKAQISSSGEAKMSGESMTVRKMKNNRHAVQGVRDPDRVVWDRKELVSTDDGRF